MIDETAIKRQRQYPFFKVLIVEDNHNFRRVFRELIREHFSSVVIDEATSGEEALMKMRTSLPDIIFNDCFIRRRF